MKIGFIGYCDTPFDKKKAQKIIEEIFTDIQRYVNEEIIIVSGASDCGVIGMIYHESEKYNYKTVGIMCKQGYDKNNQLYPCDIIYAVGNNWGDESEAFINNIDLLYKIGGGEQSMKEKHMAKLKNISVLEYEL